MARGGVEGWGRHVRTTSASVTRSLPLLPPSLCTLFFSALVRCPCLLQFLSLLSAHSPPQHAMPSTPPIGPNACMHAVCVCARARTCVCARACVRACTHRKRRYLRWRGLELAHAIGVRVGGVLRQLPGEVLEDFAKAGRLLLRGLLNTNGHRVLSGGRGAQRAALSLYARERARLTSSCMASRTRPARCGARAARGRPTPWRASAGAAVKAAEPARQAASTATQSARRGILYLFSNFFVTEIFLGLRRSRAAVPRTTTVTCEAKDLPPCRRASAPRSSR